MDGDRDHVISIVLKHDEWEQFVSLQPQPAEWLRERIHEVIARRDSESVANDEGVEAPTAHARWAR